MPIVIKRSIEHSHVNVSKVEAGRISKAAAGYIFAPGTSILCGECAFVGEGGLCSDHPGPEQRVNLEKGSCNDWQDRRQGLVAGNNSRPWVQVAYIENNNGFGCRRCEHMDLEKHDCSVVDPNSPGDNPGKIDPYACCVFWEKDPKRGNWPESRFV